MSEKRKCLGLVSVLIVTVLMLISSMSSFAKNISMEDISKNQKQASEILSVIDDYQKDYFEIIKRNDFLLQWENNKALNKDKKDLDRLYKKVTKQVTNKYYLRKYKDIQKRYAKCDEITDIGMKDFSDKNYNEINNLLSEVYREVQSKISSDDFEKLAQSETKWLKEVEDYKNVFSTMDYGTIGTLIYYDCQINMTEFRTLLLMLYL